MWIVKSVGKICKKRLVKDIKNQRIQHSNGELNGLQAEGYYINPGFQ